MEQEKLNRSFSEPDLSNFPSFRQIEEFYQTGSCDTSSIRFTSCDQIYDKSKNVIYKRTYSIISNINIQNYRSIDNKDHLYNRFSHEDPLEPINSMSRLRIQNEDVEFDSNYQNESLTPYQNCQEYSPMDVDNSDNTDFYSTYRNRFKEIPESFKYTTERLTNQQEQEQEDLQTVEQNQDIYITPNIKARRLISHQRQKDLLVLKENQKYKTSVIILTAISILVALLCYILGASFLSSEDIPQNNELIQKIVLTLNTVQYQDNAKTVVIQNLNHLYSNRKNKKVLVFVGNTGVGKTYTANLISKHVHTISVNLLLKSHLNLEKIKSLNSDECHFIIMDDLKIENLNDVLSYIDKIPDICTLIVPIFNIHTVDDNLIYTANYEHYKQIKDEFLKKFSSNVDTILFNDINRDNLEMWMSEQFKEKRRGNIEAITSLLDDHDVQSYGFKGLSAKINVLDS